jgi:hypothetical protein
MLSSRHTRNVLDWLSLFAALGLITGVATASVAWKHDAVMTVRAAQ